MFSVSARSAVHANQVGSTQLSSCNGLVQRTGRHATRSQGLQSHTHQSRISLQMFFRHHRYIHSSRTRKQNLFAENVSSWQKDILVVKNFLFKIKSLFRELSNRDPPAEVRTLKLNFSLTRLFDVDKQESRNSRILVGGAREPGFLFVCWRRQSNREAKAGPGIHRQDRLAMRAADFRFFYAEFLSNRKLFVMACHWQYLL